MFNKILYSTCALMLCATLYGMSIGHAQNPDNQYTIGKVTQVAQNNTLNDDNDNDNDMDWGWLGLIGLAGLLGLRRNDRK